MYNLELSMTSGFSWREGVLKFMSCISCLSHCHDKKKYPLKKQCRERRVCFGSQFGSQGTLVGKSWHQECKVEPFTSLSEKDECWQCLAHFPLFSPGPQHMEWCCSYLGSHLIKIIQKLPRRCAHKFVS